MMSSNNPNRARRTRGLLGLLKKTPFDVLKKLRVAVKRGNVTSQGPLGPIERSIDDPEQIRLLVNYRKGALLNHSALAEEIERSDYIGTNLTSKWRSNSPPYFIAASLGDASGSDERNFLSQRLEDKKTIRRKKTQPK